MTSFVLKIIAIAAMLIDHVGYVFDYDLPPDVYWACRAVGRVAFPLFAFLLAEGFFYTRDPRKYLLRLAIFAVVSELPFDLMTAGEPLDWGYQSVYVTLTLALFGLYLFDSFAAGNNKVAALLTLVSVGIAAQIFHADYGAVGVLMVFVFYFFRGKRAQLAAMFAVTVLLFMMQHYFEAHMEWGKPVWVTLFELGALVPILLYNRRKGYAKRWIQWGFYAFYPAHMLILLGVSMLIFGV
ncbi:fimbrial assembly protein fimC [Clostridia bacterium]|nr:fimbrial assembly protein fimC [Clostridia bacterium]